jgi:hypothetical protein
MKVVADFVPDWTDYLTAGKMYHVRWIDEYGCGCIWDDSGEETYIKFKSCGHLGGKSWIVVDE